MTATAVWWNTVQTLRGQLEDSVKLAQQIGAQGEAIVLDSYSATVHDPIGRAAQLLSQGVDPRLIKVTKVERISETVWPKLGVNRAPAGIRERWDMSPQARRFDFWKILSDETGHGIRVTLALPFPGLFGTRSQGANDAMVFGLFGTFLTLTLSLFALVFRKTPTAFGAEAAIPAPLAVETAPLAPTTAQVMDAALRERLLVRIHQMRETLVETGKHVRDVVKSAQALTDASVQSREAMISLRSGVHMGLTQLRDSARQLREWEKSFGIVDAILSKNPREITAEELSFIKKAIAESRVCWDLLAYIERTIEPWTVDLDLAVNGYEDFFGSTDDMNAQVRKAMGTLIEKNKLLSEVKSDLEAKPAA